MIPLLHSGDGDSTSLASTVRFGEGVFSEGIHPPWSGAGLVHPLTKRTTLPYHLGMIECPVCGDIRDARQPSCDRCRKRAKRRRQSERQKGIVARVKKAGCQVCGEKDPASLTFHHLDETSKLHDIGTMTARHTSMLSLLLEIQKCTVVCRPCHDKIHRGEITPVLHPIELTVQMTGGMAVPVRVRV